MKRSGYQVLAFATVLLLGGAGCRRSVDEGAGLAFIPGPLGRETATRASSPSQERAFRTRTMGNVTDEWGQANHLTKPLAFSHHLDAVFPRTLANAHSEFFPLADGARLTPAARTVFWNPDLGREDVARFAATAARDHFQQHPGDVSFALGVNDGLVFGESPETRAFVTPVKWFRDRPDYSPLVFTFMNRTAAELAQTHPDKYLGCLAYYWCENVPPFAVHRQVIPFLTADRAQGYDPAFWREEMALQERWGALAGDQGTGGRGQETERRRLGLYDYLYGNGYLIPRIYPHLLGEHLRHARRAGFTDYYAECNPNWGLDGPMPWLTAQLLQDPEQSVDALLDEYYARYFQEAAEPMRAFFERCEKLWLEQPRPGYWLKHFRNESQVVVFPPEACAELRHLLDDAARRAGSEKVKQRVALVSAAFGVTERLVRFCGARDTLTKAVSGQWSVVSGQISAGKGDEVLAALQAYLGARREFIRYTLEVQRTQPLAVAKFTWDDYLRNDPVGGALLALAELATPDQRDTIRRTIDGIGFADVSAVWRSIGKVASQEVSAKDQGPRTKDLATPHNLLRNPMFSGDIKPARTIADLRYGAALPAEWLSRVEPAEHQTAELRPAELVVSGQSSVVDGQRRDGASTTDHGPRTTDQSRILRLSGNKDTAISQWNPVRDRGLHRAAVQLRGKVSSSSIITLTFAWLDQKERHLGFKALRLPVGEWPEWVTLQQAGLPPPNAVWVGVGIRVQHQLPGDYVEATGFSLTAGR